MSPPSNPGTPDGNGMETVPVTLTPAPIHRNSSSKSAPTEILS